MKDIKELNIMEMEKVSGGVHYVNGVPCERVMRYKVIKVNGVQRVVPYYVSVPVEELNNHR